MRPLALCLTFASAVALAGAVGWYGGRLLEREPDPAAAATPAEDAAPAARATGRVPVPGPRDTQGDTHGATHGAAHAPRELNAAGGGRAWVERNREAIAALEAGLLDEAIAGFEACLEALPDEPVLRANLAEALVRKAVRDQEALRPCEHCVELLTRAIELAPEREDLALLRARWEREAAAEADFWRERSLHFELAYDGSRDEILWGSHRLLELLEQGYDDYGLFFGHYPVEAGRPRIAVSLYRRESFDQLTGLGDWAGGAFDGTVRVPVGDFELEEERLRRVLRHELVHAFVREVGGTRVPGWLNEGLAQWLEDQRAEQLEAARAALTGRELFPLERLEGSLASWDDADQIALAYAQSLLFVDHLARTFGEALLVELVRGCAQGEPPAATFERAIHVPLATALGDLASELR